MLFFHDFVVFILLLTLLTIMLNIRVIYTTAAKQSGENRTQMVPTRGV